MKHTYLHFEIPELASGFLDKGMVHLGDDAPAGYVEVMKIALQSMRLAVRLGIAPPSLSAREALPYEEDNDTLVFKAPLTSALVNKNILYLRSWKQFDSCIKGFNSLGLIAELVLAEMNRLRKLTRSDLNALKLEFLKSRELDGQKVFTTEALTSVDENELLTLDLQDLAVWSSLAFRPIYCATSTNMGVSSHQILRLMQKAEVKFRDKSFTLLNANEGRLTIWCPDPRADFMNDEKSTLLQDLEKEQPRITTLRTYINRQQRDPGALQDALLAGGYFFPTNPQSKEEMQNLVFVALKEIAKEKRQGMDVVLSDPKVIFTLESIGCEIENDGGVVVHRGVDAGLYGLMTPYFIMLDEVLQMEGVKAIATWNQASIGAALAAAVQADNYLRTASEWPDDLRSQFNSLFPSLSKFLDSYTIGADIQTRIHGVFDIANLQSLAQLLGVVVEKHMSGRGTAYVGLGSSSYANGNRCFDILRDSSEENGAFRGKLAFHPATHTMNPVAQAIIFGEDLYRYLCRIDLPEGLTDAVIGKALQHAKKPEPAGAAALAGYMLAQLDRGTLSIVEIAYVLKLLGYSTESFLEFAGHGKNGTGLRTFIQEAKEEGHLMGSFAQNILLLLDWPLEELEKKMAREKSQSRARYWDAPLDDLSFECLNGQICLYITGDHTTQPSLELTRELANLIIEREDELDKFLASYTQSAARNRLSAPFRITSFILNRTSSIAHRLGESIEGTNKRMIQRLVSAETDKDQSPRVH